MSGNVFRSLINSALGLTPPAATRSATPGARPERGRHSTSSAASGSSASSTQSRSTKRRRSRRARQTKDAGKGVGVRHSGQSLHRYEQLRRSQQRLALCMIIGVFTGMFVGFSIGNMPITMGVGLALGLAIGILAAG